MDASPPPTRWARRVDTLWRRSLDCVILLPLQAEEPLRVSASGAAVWELLAEPATVAELVEVLAEVTGEPVARLTADVEGLLTELEDLGAVEQVP